MKSTLTVQSLQLLLFFDSNLSTWGSPLLVIKVSRFLKVISGSRNSILTLTFINLAVTRVFFYQLKKPHFADLIWKQPALQWNLQRYSKQIWMIACRSSVKDLKWAKCFVRNMFKLRWFYFHFTHCIASGLVTNVIIVLSADWALWFHSWVYFIRPSVRQLDMFNKFYPLSKKVTPMVISKWITTLILRRRHLKFSHFIFAPRTSKGNVMIIQIQFLAL